MIAHDVASTRAPAARKAAKASGRHAAPAQPQAAPGGCACGGGCPRCGSPGGKPLDSGVRGVMERRFGESFGDVRVHDNAAAHAAAAGDDALAYVEGRDIVFGAGQYRPHTLSGQWVIAHELAHVVQQRGARTDGAGASRLESAAHEAATNVALGGNARVAAAASAPVRMHLRVSQGGFGKALEYFTDMWHVEDKAVRLLQKSPTFMKLAFTLDQAYVHPFDPRFAVRGVGEWEVGADGRMVKPAAAAGKRPLFFFDDTESFQTINAPGNNLSGDVISIKATDTPTFIQGLAHEATHAARFVGAAAPQAQSLVDEVEAGIKDEIAARQSEAKILGEIPDKQVQANVATVASLDARQVERDVSPAFNLTYMELFFFGREMKDAQKAEGLDEQRAMEIRQEVDKNMPSGPFILGKPLPSGITPLSDYAETYFARQTCVAEWKKFMQDNDASDPTFDAEKEKVLQDHVTRLFKGKISYRP
jgi:hypothetical protein